MAFYGLFAVTLLWRHRFALTILTLVLITVAICASTGIHTFFYGADDLLFEFAAGMAAANLFLRCREPRRFRKVAVVVLIAACGAVSLSMLAYPRWFAWRGMVWGVPAAAIVGAATFLDQGASEARVVNKTRLRRIFERLGEASYSLYLTHILFFRMFSRVAMPLLNANIFGAWLYAVLGTGGTIMVSFTIYRYLEKPLTAALGVTPARSVSVSDTTQFTPDVGSSGR